MPTTARGIFYPASTAAPRVWEDMQTAATSVNTALDTLDTAKAAASHSHAASAITSGVLGTARLGAGTADTNTFLRGDGTWAAAGASLSRARTNPVVFDEFLAPGPGVFAFVQAGSGGYLGKTTTDSNHPGVVLLSGGSSSGSGMTICGSVQSRFRAQAGMSFQAVFSMESVATSTSAYIGLHNSTSAAAPTDGVCLFVSGSSASFFAKNSVTAVTTILGSATLSTSPWYRVEIDIVSSTSAKCRLFDATSGAVVIAEQTFTTGVPSDSSCKVTPAFNANSSATTSPSLVALDFMGFEMAAGSALTR